MNVISKTFIIKMIIREQQHCYRRDCPKIETHRKNEEKEKQKKIPNTHTHTLQIDNKYLGN